MTKLYYIIALGCISICGCKSASKAYQKGEYTQAIELGVRKLQKNPADKSTRDMIQKAYDYEIKEHEENVQTLTNSNSELRFERIFEEYNHLQHLYFIIHSAPSVAEVISLKDYSTYLATYSVKAATIHSDKAESWMNEGNKMAYREAFKEYCAALQYLPDDFELKRKREDAY